MAAQLTAVVGGVVHGRECMCVGSVRWQGDLIVAILEVG